MTKAQKHRLAAGIAILLLIAYVLLYVGAMIVTWNTSQAGDDPRPADFGGLFTWAATFLSGVVGGIVAVAFGVSLPDPNTRDTLVTQQGVGDWLQQAIATLGGWLWPSQSSAANVARLYVLAYILVAALAFIVAIFREKVAPDMLTTLPTVALGLGGAVVTAYFGRK